MFGSPMFMLRQKMILKKFRNCGATSEVNAKTLKEAGIFNPDVFSKATDDLVNKNKLVKTKSQKYYLAD